jgi:hypothetical protein
MLDGQDSSCDAGQSQRPFDPISQLQFQQRVATIQRWLALMGAMPAEEPSPDLVTRTLHRVDEARAAQAAEASPDQARAGSGL